MILANSYRFVWTDAAINRDTNNLVSAALEPDEPSASIVDYE